VDRGSAAEVDTGASVKDLVASEPVGPSAPDRVVRFPSELPFEISRPGDGGDPPTATEVQDFTRRMARFFATTGYFRWTRRHSHGLAEENPWGEPPYMYWWQNATAVKEGDLVTFRHEGGADNMMAHTGRIFGPVAGAFLTLTGPAERAPLRELVLGYIRGVSAMIDGSIWAEEDPVVDTIMARAIFHRNHTWELEGGRKAAVDYEPFERWDLWSEDLDDGEHDYFPGRESQPEGGPAKTHIWIPEMPNLFEYCASPVRARGGAAFVDCDVLTDSADWPTPAR